MIHIIFWIFVGMILAVLIWFGVSVFLAVTVAHYEIKTAPREPMYICKVHGPIRKENLIVFANYEFADIDPVTNKPVRRVGDYEQCMLCFHKRLVDVETTIL